MSIEIGSKVRVVDDGTMLFTNVQWEVTRLDWSRDLVTLKSPNTGNLLTVTMGRVQKLDVE